MPGTPAGHPGGRRNDRARPTRPGSGRPPADHEATGAGLTTTELPGSFAALGVAPELVSALESQGITEPFPIQALTIADALAGRDVCGKAKTGSGKTLAFGVPVLQRLGDSRQSGRRRQARRPPAGPGAGPDPGAGPPGGRRAAAPGREGRPAADRVLRRGRAWTPRSKRWPRAPTWWWPRPGRLIDLRQRGDVDLSRIEVLVLDEADRMADMGFMPQVEWLLRHLVGDHQTMLFSATLDGDVDRLVRVLPHRPGPPRGGVHPTDGHRDGPPLSPGPSDGQGQGGGGHLPARPAVAGVLPGPSGGPTG